MRYRISGLHSLEEVNNSALVDFLRYLGPILFVVGLVGFWKTSRRLWATVDTPTMATGHVTIGQIEVAGKAGVAPGHSPVQSPLSSTTCVWFKAEIQQETGSGKNKSWKTRHTSTSSPVCVVDDGSGAVLINLAGVSPTSAASSTISARDLPAFVSADDLDRIAKGDQYSPNPYVGSTSLVTRLLEEVVPTFRSNQPVAELGGKWRIVETRIEQGSDLYVHGSTLYDHALHQVRFEKKPKRPLFVYNGPQPQLIKNSRRLVIVSTLVVVIGTFLTGASWRSLGVDPTRRLNAGAGLFLLAPLACFGLSVQIIRIRNRIAATANQLKAGQGLVDIALSKRANLIPNLVAVVQAAASHTETVIEHLTRLRTEPVSGAAALSELNVVGERYPALGTSANFLQLQQSLSEVETDLAVASGFVADARAVHQTRIQSFPDSFVASMFGFRSA